jgi:hypothetical protein
MSCTENCSCDQMAAATAGRVAGSKGSIKHRGLPEEQDGPVSECAAPGRWRCAGVNQCRTSDLEEAKREKATGHRKACIWSAGGGRGWFGRKGCLTAGYIRTSPCWALRERLEASERGGLHALPPPIDFAPSTLRAMSELLSTDELKGSATKHSSEELLLGQEQGKRRLLWSNNRADCRRLSMRLKKPPPSRVSRPVSPRTYRRRCREDQPRQQWISRIPTPAISTAISHMKT